jgi:hypothetical protein
MNTGFPVPVTSHPVFKKKTWKHNKLFFLPRFIVVFERSIFSFELFDDVQKHRAPLRHDTNNNQGIPRRANHNQISVLKTGKFATKVCDEVNR